jgi:hypothetical protein
MNFVQTQKVCFVLIWIDCNILGEASGLYGAMEKARNSMLSQTQIEGK